jgi:fatty acid elongase 3
VVAKYLPDTLPYIGNCAGSEDAAVFGCVLLSIYLGLFINFYFQTYKKPVATRKSSSNDRGVANGRANGTGFVLEATSRFLTNDPS